MTGAGCHTGAGCAVLTGGEPANGRKPSCGVIGRSLIPALTAAGHQVTATTRSPAKAGLLMSLGA